MKQILGPKVLIAMLALAAFLLMLTFAWIFLGRQPASSGTGPADAVMTVIPAPTSTPLPATPAVVTAQPQGTPTLLPGGFGIGVFVQITGTGGDGLRVRSEPGLTAQSLFLGYDAEVFKVLEGPVPADGHTWWKLSAPYDTSRSGWAAQDYLTVIQTP